MTKLRYTQRGWFRIIDMMSGTTDFRTGARFPDEYGCYTRRLVVGPFDNAEQAAAA